MKSKRATDISTSGTYVLALRCNLDLYPLSAYEAGDNQGWNQETSLIECKFVQDPNGPAVMQSPERKDS